MRAAARRDGDVHAAPRCHLQGGRARTIDELWCVIRGRGRIWRKIGDREDVTDLVAGVSVAIPTGAHFQFRNDGSQPLDIIAATMPPWPGDGEAYLVDGKWEPTV